MNRGAKAHKHYKQFKSASFGCVIAIQEVVKTFYTLLPSQRNFYDCAGLYIIDKVNNNFLFTGFYTISFTLIFHHFISTILPITINLWHE